MPLDLSTAIPVGAGSLVDHRKGEEDVNVTVDEISLGSSLYPAARTLREEVLRAPLGLSLTPGDLRKDAECFHLVAKNGGHVIGVLLLQPLNTGTVQMRQVAVHPSYQAKGVGSQLVSFAEAFAKGKGFEKIIAHARSTAVNFYLHNGYRAEGEEFIETTIPHRLVVKELS